jgi:hypothetical protein
MASYNLARAQIEQQSHHRGDRTLLALTSLLLSGAEPALWDVSTPD